MMPVNGYPAMALDEQLFARMPEFTGSFINRRLERVQARLDAGAETILVSLGENCAAAGKLREAGLARLGSHYFDNLVISAPSIARLLDEDFGHILLLRNLVILRWENQDSVFDQRYGVYFHHYFHLRGMELEKNDLSEGARRRRIDEADIPLFLPMVLAQFEYLAAKMRLVLRHARPKILVLRPLAAQPASVAVTTGLAQALQRFGARNVSLLVIHSVPWTEADAAACDTGLHRFVPEDGTRWGPAERWRDVLAPS